MACGQLKRRIYEDGQGADINLDFYRERINWQLASERCRDSAF